MAQLIAVYTDSLAPEPYGVYVGTTEQLIAEMERLTTVRDGNEFTTEFVAWLEDFLVRNGYALTSGWRDEIEYWEADITKTR